MNWSDARSYFISRIAVTDPDLREWRDAFNIENVPATLLDTFYQITFNGILSTPNQGGWVQDTINLTINIWKNGCDEPVDALDALLDKALCIRKDAIGSQAVEAFGFKGAVENVSVTPFPIDETNDNIIRVEIEFNIRNFIDTI